MNAVIAPFKEPLPCQDTMEWPFCDCKPLLVVNHSGQSHGLLLYTVLCYCQSNYVIQVFYSINIFSFISERQQSMLLRLKQGSVLFCFLLLVLCPCSSHFGEKEHPPWPSAQIFTIWLFFDRVTVFDTVVWITNLLWRSSCDVRVHRKCNFNAQLQHMLNEFLSLCVWGQFLNHYRSLLW